MAAAVVVAAATSAAAAAVNAPCCSCAAKVDAKRAAELEARSRELLAAAEAGDADALCEVGLVLMSNAVRKTEQKRAFGYLKQAAEKQRRGILEKTAKEVYKKTVEATQEAIQKDAQKKTQNGQTRRRRRRSEKSQADTDTTSSSAGQGASLPPPTTWPSMFYNDTTTVNQEWSSIVVQEGPWIINLTQSLAAIGGPVDGNWTLQVRCPSLELPTRTDLLAGVLVKRPYTAGTVGARCGTGGYFNGYVLQLEYSYGPYGNETATTTVSKNFYSGEFTTPLRLASEISYFPTGVPQLEVYMAPSEVKYLNHMQPKSGTGWMPACVTRTTNDTPLLFMFPYVSPASAPGLQSPITLLKYCDEMQQGPYKYDIQEFAYIIDHVTYSSACKAVESESNSDAASVVQRLAMLGYSQSEVFSDELKCGNAITGDAQAYHALTPYRDLLDGQGSSFNLLVDFRTSPVPSLRSYLYLDILRNVGWLDDLTVQVEVAMITYNPNLQFISEIVVTFDIDIAGRVTAEFEIDSFPYTLQPHDLETGFRFALELLVMISVAMTIVSEIRDMLGVKGCCAINRNEVIEKLQAWWGDGWNVIDMTRIVLFIAAIFIWADLWQKIDNELTPYIGDHSITTVQQYSKTRTAFTECKSLLNSYAVVNGLNLMVHLVWILKYFRHPRLAIVRKSIMRSGDDLAHFGLIFAVIFGTYTVMANLFFGEKMELYHTFGYSLETCLLMVLGDFDYWALREAWPLGAYIFFWSFIFLCSLILFNMIIGIVFVAYDMESSERDDSNLYSGMRDQMWHSLRHMKDKGTKAEAENGTENGTGNVANTVKDDKVSIQLNEVKSSLDLESKESSEQGEIRPLTIQSPTSDSPARDLYNDDDVRALKYDGSVPFV